MATAIWEATMAETASFSHSPLGGAAQAVPSLIIGVQCARPLAASRLCVLQGLNEVGIGRGDTHELEVDQRANAVQLKVPDRWMSSGHARFLRKGNAWLLSDRSSKNGSYLNNERVREASLEDGDVIEVGSTFMVFKSAVPKSVLDNVPSDPSELPETFCGEYRQALGDLALIAPSKVPVLLCGETGSGKEVAARRLHKLSGRRGPFLGVNCAAIADTLAESELFGHKKGAFSGAHDERPGLIRAANGGTLMLDEIAELDARLQAKLLRVLQEREVLPVGATSPIAVDVRVVSASSRELRGWVTEGHFRDDLFARLAGHEVALPALRDRTEDLGLLLSTLLKRVMGDEAADVTLQREAVRLLYAYRWPRNIRELEQAIGAAAALAAGGSIGPEHLPKELRDSVEPQDGSLAESAQQMSRETLAEVMTRHRGNVSAVGRELGKARVQIRRWCKRFGIDPEAFRGESEADGN